MQVDVKVRGVEEADSGAAECAHHGDPGALLLGQQEGRVEVQHLGGVARRARDDVRLGLQVEAQVGQLGRESARDQDGVAGGIGQDLFLEAVFGVRALDGERRDSRLDPANFVDRLRGVIDRGRARRGHYEAQARQGRPSQVILHRQNHRQLILETVTEQQILIAQIQAAMRDDRMRPNLAARLA